MKQGLVALLTSISLGLGEAAVRDAWAAAQQVDQVQPDGQALLTVTLPNLDGLHPSVQKQLRQAYATLVEQLQGGVTPGARAEAFGALGKQFMATRFNDEAERALRNAERLAPLDFRWSYYLGHVLRNGGDLSEAAESFERVRLIRPADFPTLVWLGRIYLDLARPEAAEQRLTEARLINPRHSAVRVELGRAALAQRDYQRAVEHLTAALAMSPEIAAIHYPLGMAYRGLGELEKAAEHLERRGVSGSRRTMTEIPFPDPLLAALSGIVQTPQVYRERGLDAAANGNWPEAVKNFRLAVDADPGHASMRVNLAAALDRVSDARGALEQYEHALRLDSSLAEAHFGLADLLERGGREQEALAQFRAAVAANANFIDAHLRLADALRRTDQLEESLTHYRQVIALEPADVAARFGEAMALVRLARFAEARDRLTEGVTVDPDQPIFRLALARVLSAAPDDRVRDGARAWKLIEGISKEQSHPGGFETLAMVLAELGHFDLAIDWQRLAMSTAARAGRADVAQKMAANLARYHQRQPCRVPWRDDDPDHRPGPRINPKLLDANSPEAR
jgi:tetratricopeptide (TPR) repeat protein